MINKRIRAIAQLIENDKSVIDIGCDHGYLAMLLRINGNTSPIICCDEKQGPLNNAKSNLKKYNNIEYYCTDGVKNIQKQAQIAVMAGMGHHTVEHILQQSQDYFRNCEKIIIQVNHIVSSMRRYLSENNYRIIDEVVVKDYKYYEIICAKNGFEKLSEDEIEFGPILLNKKDEIFCEYYKNQINHIDLILEKMAVNHPDRKVLEDKKNKIYNMLFSNIF